MSFGQLWIGSHPTPYRNRYAVLHLDFSQVTGTIDELKANFDDYCGIVIDSFARRYERLFYKGFANDMKQWDWASKKLNFKPNFECVLMIGVSPVTMDDLTSGYLQGFFTAYLNMTNYYLTAPELELSHGYCDFFLLPDLGRYPMVAHSYILELKYLKQDAAAEAVSQITRYARDEKVRLLCGPTQLHLVVAQYRGYQLVRLEEVIR